MTDQHNRRRRAQHNSHRHHALMPNAVFIQCGWRLDEAYSGRQQDDYQITPVSFCRGQISTEKRGEDQYQRIQRELRAYQEKLFSAHLELLESLATNWYEVFKKKINSLY